MNFESLCTAEQSVIGAIILDESALIQVIDFLKPEDFYFDELKACYKAILSLSSRGEAIDFVTVLNQVTATNEKFSKNAMKSVLMRCTEITPAVSNISNYAKIILNSKKARKIQEISKKVLSDGINAETADETADYMISELFEVAINRQHKSLQDIGKIGLDLFKSYGQPSKSRVNTGFPRLDEKLKGLDAGNLVILAARPKVGKTAFALSIAENVAKFGKLVAFYSLGGEPPRARRAISFALKIK